MARCRRCCKYYCYVLYLPVLLALVAHIAWRGISEGADGWGGVPRTLEEETELCPTWVTGLLRWKIGLAINSYQALEGSLNDAKDMSFHSDWASDYMVAFYALGRMMLAAYSPRTASSVKTPLISASAPAFSVGSVTAPDRDIDGTVYWPLEAYVPRFLWDKFFPTFFNCAQGVVREYDFLDDLAGNSTNVWHTLLGGTRRKRDFVMSFFDGHTLFDGTSPMYPAFENDLAQLFLKADTWDDGLEKAMAFDLIGTHRVEQTSRVLGGETLPFKVALNDYSQLDVRPHFGRYGGDMYFTGEGLPVLIVTPDGREVVRGDKDWQYWKFVWRSSLCSIITLIDHLHLTHYRTANMLASISRKALPAKHPLRRLTSIFSFGSIFINNMAHHMLIGGRSPLHRATPFKEFEALGSLIPKTLKSVTHLHTPILDDDAYQQLPPLLRNAPYFADGRLMAKAIQKMVHGIYDVVLQGSGRCRPETNYTITDPHYLRYLNEGLTFEYLAGYASRLVPRSFHDHPSCEMFATTLPSAIWTITGFHRHVGSVADYFADPDLAGFSWKEGESSPRPLQAMLMSVVAAVTGTPHPKINEDFTHLFADLPEGEAMSRVWQTFREDLGAVQAEVHRRNEKRRVKNYHADPSIVECSVAV